MVDSKSLSDEELKQRVKENRAKEKADIKKGLKTPILRNPIDKLTNIDELLRENIIAQRDLFDEQRRTNKLLLAIYYKDGTGGSIQPNGVDVSTILEGLREGEGLGRSDDYRTLNKVIHNDTGDKTILKIEGSGIIDVIKFVSSNASVVNKDYSVRIRCDDTILYENTWAELEARSPNERGMIAFEEDMINNEYLIIFKTISYSESFMIEIYNSNATFSLIQVKYHERV